MHFYVGFTLFVVLLYIVISQRFFILHFYVFSVACCHPFPMTWRSVLRFLSLYVILIIVSYQIVSCMLYVVKEKHCPEEAYLNRWAKRRQNNEIIARKSNLSPQSKLFINRKTTSRNYTILQSWSVIHTESFCIRFHDWWTTELLKLIAY